MEQVQAPTTTSGWLSLAGEAEEILSLAEQLLSRRDTERWHAGHLTRATAALARAVQAHGAGGFQLWGMAAPEGSEDPLTLNLA